MCTPSNTWFLDLADSVYQTAFRSVQPFLYGSSLAAQSPYNLQWAAPLPSQNCALAWGIWPIMQWFHGPTRVNIPNEISIGSAILRGSRSRQKNRPTDRSTDRPRYSVCSNRPHLHSTAMRTNKRKPKSRFARFWLAASAATENSAAILSCGLLLQTE